MKSIAYRTIKYVFCLQQVEERVLVRARNLSKQLNLACQSALKYVQNSPRLHPLLNQVSLLYFICFLFRYIMLELREICDCCRR